MRAGAIKEPYRTRPSPCRLRRLSLSRESGRGSPLLPPARVALVHQPHHRVEVRAAGLDAGHLRLVTFFMLSNYLFWEASGALKGVAVLTFGAAFAFTLFEISKISGTTLGKSKFFDASTRNSPLTCGRASVSLYSSLRAIPGALREVDKLSPSGENCP